MNKRVFVSMIVLVVAFLFGMYILKFFFPEQFLFAIENETIIEIGNYIDSHAWAYYIVGIATSFLTYWLYLCAVCGKRKLSIKEMAVVLAVIGISIGISFLDEAAVSIVSYISLIALPVLFGCRNIKALAIVFGVHILAQYLSLQIRDLPLFMEQTNTFIFLLMTAECYFWLILFYIIYNYKSEVKTNGLEMSSTVREQKEQILREENRESRKGNQETK